MTYRFLIYISYSYAIPIGNPLESAIKKRGYEVQWFADQSEGKKALRSKNNSIQHVKEVLDYKPHVILAATDSVPDFINALKVQVFHGFNAEKRPSKKNQFSHFRLRGFFDLYCTQGPNTTNRFKELAEKHKYFEVVETGWPKVDALFPLDKNENQRKEPFTVMIASTFTESLSLAYREDVRQEIEQLSKSGRFKFIMVLHPKMPNAIVQKWQSLTHDNFQYYDTADLVPLYKKANIMFADTTSAIQEFLLQLKPVVTFNHTFKHDYLIDINQATEIESALHQGLEYPKDLLGNIRNYIKELHPYNDGKSSERIINECLNSLHKEKDHLKSKPLNLVRKYKMRKRLKHFTLKSYGKPYTIQKLD